MKTGILLLNLLLPASLMASTIVVTSSDDGGEGSLREAIIRANSIKGADTIEFNITPGGSQSIKLLSPLPEIDGPVWVNGQSQPGSADTLCPMIELDGALAGPGNGLTLASHGSRIDGLAIINFDGHGILVRTNGGNNVIAGCSVGVDVG